MDRYSALGCAAAALALEHAPGVRPQPDDASWGVIVGSSLGCWASNGEYLDALADHFANGGRFGVALSRRGILSAEEVEELAAEYHALRVVEVAPEHSVR